MSCRLIIDIDRCKGCALCIGVCSRHVLALSKALNPSGYHFPQTLAAHACSGCRQCAIICPEAAIEIERTTDRQQGRVSGPSKPERN